MSSLYSLLHPAGVSAAGVAALRLGVALLVLVLLDAPPFRGSGVSTAAWLCAGALAAGFLTRLLALLAAACAVVAWRQSADAMHALFAVAALASFALAMIGAGAFSVDAHLFGRRVIELDG